MRKLTLKIYIVLAIFIGIILGIFLGIACGSVFYNLMNEIYSNDFINNGGWKILYVIVITLLLVIFVFSKFYLKKNLIIILDSNNIKNNTFVTNYLNSFILFIPILCFLLFLFLIGYQNSVTLTIYTF